MNKSELITKIADDAEITKAAAEKALSSFIDAVGKTVASGNRLSVIGFGTFSLSERAARKGRNPATGEEIAIKASKGVKFKAGKALNEKVK